MSEKVCQSFAERLSILKDSMEGMRKSTIQEFAQIVGVTRPTMSYYLSGQREPDASTVRQICQKCNVSADWLLGLSDERTLDANARAAAEYTGLSGEAVEELQSELFYYPEVKDILSKLLTFEHFERALWAIHSASLCMEKASQYLACAPALVSTDHRDPPALDPESGFVTLDPFNASRFFARMAQAEFADAVKQLMPEDGNSPKVDGPLDDWLGWPEVEEDG